LSLLSAESPDPVTAHVIKTSKFMTHLPFYQHDTFAAGGFEQQEPILALEPVIVSSADRNTISAVMSY